tara:strand:+ start:3570 stop:3785 length:216 start_codon:yes stop_codon:yes gene_type:complete
MVRIIVDDGKIEVFCKDKEQALEYVEQLRVRGHTNFILKESKNEQRDSRGQIQKDLRKPIEVRKAGDFEGL